MNASPHCNEERTNMNGSTAGSETPGELGRRKFLARACGILAAPLAVVIG
jgi:hypothetical protein